MKKVQSLDESATSAARSLRVRGPLAHSVSIVVELANDPQLAAMSPEDHENNTNNYKSARNDDDDDDDDHDNSAMIRAGDNNRGEAPTLRLAASASGSAADGEHAKGGVGGAEIAQVVQDNNNNNDDDDDDDDENEDEDEDEDVECLLANGLARRVVLVDEADKIFLGRARSAEPVAAGSSREPGPAGAPPGARCKSAADQLAAGAPPPWSASPSPPPLAVNQTTTDGGANHRRHRHSFAFSSHSPVGGGGPPTSAGTSKLAEWGALHPLGMRRNTHHQALGVGGAAVGWRTPSAIATQPAATRVHQRQRAHSCRPDTSVFGKFVFDKTNSDPRQQQATLVYLNQQQLQQQQQQRHNRRQSLQVAPSSSHLLALGSSSHLAGAIICKHQQATRSSLAEEELRGERQFNEQVRIATKSPLACDEQPKQPAVAASTLINRHSSDNNTANNSRQQLAQFELARRRKTTCATLAQLSCSPATGTQLSTTPAAAAAATTTTTTTHNRRRVSFSSIDPIINRPPAAATTYDDDEDAKQARPTGWCLGDPFAVAAHHRHSSDKQQIVQKRERQPTSNSTGSSRQMSIAICEKPTILKQKRHSLATNTVLRVADSKAADGKSKTNHHDKRQQQDQLVDIFEHLKLGRNSSSSKTATTTTTTTSSLQRQKDISSTAPSQMETTTMTTTTKTPTTTLGDGVADATNGDPAPQCQREILVSSAQTAPTSTICEPTSFKTDANNTPPQLLTRRVASIDMTTGSGSGCNRQQIANSNSTSSSATTTTTTSNRPPAPRHQSKSICTDSGASGDRDESRVQSIMANARLRQEEFARLLEEHEQIVNEINRVETKMSNNQHALAISKQKQEAESKP